MMKNKVRMAIDVVVFLIFFFVEFNDILHLDGMACRLVSGIENLIGVAAAIDFYRCIVKEPDSNRN